ncbi:MAG: choice-of-anchor J domain-containing protein [Bacteroidaceae bacterium]
MRKISIYAFALWMAGSIGQLSAQVLSESFEGETFPPEGWTTQYTPEEGIVKYWERYHNDTKQTLDGYAYAGVSTGDGTEPEKEEWLITPTIDIPADGTYSLQFMWYAQRMGFEKYGTQFEVRARENGSDAWTCLWDIRNEEQVAASGVTVPWKQWTVYTSDVSLEAYAGKSIQVAFWYKSTPQQLPDSSSPDGYWYYTCGLIYLDGIRIDKLPELAPEVSGSTSYKFEDVYIGVEKRGGLTLKNNGRAVLTVSNISGLEGTDFSTDLGERDIALQGGEETTYTVRYTPTLTGKADATLTIETNGGTLQVALSGTKTMLPSGYTLESFEGDAFPPAGWESKGWRMSKTIGISGNQSIANGILEQCHLTSPRLDLRSGNEKITFDFIEDLFDESGQSIPINDFNLEIKVDDGEWEEIWYNKDLKFQEIIRVTLPLAAASDNCYLRWNYTGDFSDPTDQVISDIYLDDIVLPPLYKGEGLLGSKNPTPANETADCAYTGLTLAWESVLFAEGYRVYLGTDAANPTSTVNGIAVTETTYATGPLAPATTYYWKVVPFNASGEATDVPVWSFTTMPDQTIRVFPYVMNFDDCTTALPLGWEAQGDGRGWNVNDFSPYEGKRSCSVFLNGFEPAQAALQTPLIELPGEPIVASFVWGKNMPVRLEKQTEGSVLTGTDNGNDLLTFEVKTEANGEWTELARTYEEQYWAGIIVPLQAYAGKQIWLRWRYAAQNGYDAGAGGAIDNLYLGTEAGLGIANLRSGNLMVYPTVADDIIRLQGAAADAEAVLFDVAGNAVRRMKGANEMRVSDLAKGVYLLRVDQQGKTATVRILKK